MSTAIAVHHTSPLPSREPDRLSNTSGSSSSSKAYAPIVTARNPTNPTTRPMSTSRASPPPSSVANVAPRSPTEDERAALQIQQLSASAPQPMYEKHSPTNSHGSQSRSGNSETSATLPPRIKKERQSSPDPSKASTTPTTTSSSRQHRPRRLDLSNNMPVQQASATARPSAPLTSKDTGTLSAMHDVGLACLSPGFQTQDPTKQEQLARSMDLREQQRQIIESRLNRSVGKDVDIKGATEGPSSSSFSKPLGTSRRKGPPPGLSITAPSALHFASEPRVVHSAPINQSFTGLKPAPAHVHPLSRQVLEHSHHHHHHHQSSDNDAAAPPPQFGPISASHSSQRLPPIQDVFASANEGTTYRPTASLSRENSRTLYAPFNNFNASQRSPLSAQHPATLPSPGLPQTSTGQQPAGHSREREFRSAEEAVQTLSGGREDLLPKIVHYNPNQPPTPPSPLPPGHSQSSAASHSHLRGSSSSQSQMPQYGPLNSLTTAAAAMAGGRPEIGRRRTREEYERDYGDGERMEVDGEQRERMRMRSGEWRDVGREELGVGDGGEEARRRRVLRAREKKEEFLALCARAWELLHEP